MPLEVHYVNDKSWNAETNKFDDPKLHQEADDIGHFLMTIGISEVSEKTICEIVIRKLILERLYDPKNHHSPLELHKIFARHIGLKIEGRWSSNESRLKFATRHLKGMSRDIENKVEREI